MRLSFAASPLLCSLSPEGCPVPAVWWLNTHLCFTCPGLSCMGLGSVREEEDNFWELCARKEENRQESFGFA